MECRNYKPRQLLKHGEHKREKYMTVCANCGGLPHAGSAATKNRFDLDVGYFRKNLNILLRDMDNTTPDEMRSALMRLALAV